MSRQVRTLDTDIAKYGYPSPLRLRVEVPTDEQTRAEGTFWLDSAALQQGAPRLEVGQLLDLEDRDGSTRRVLVVDARDGHAWCGYRVRLVAGVPVVGLDLTRHGHATVFRTRLWRAERTVLRPGMLVFVDDDSVPPREALVTHLLDQGQRCELQLVFFADLADLRAHGTLRGQAVAALRAGAPILVTDAEADAVAAKVTGRDSDGTVHADVDWDDVIARVPPPQASRLNAILARIEARPGAAERITAIVDDMNRQLAARPQPAVIAPTGQTPTAPTGTTRDRRDALEKVRARVEAWNAAHPGYDERNWTDAFRRRDGQLEDSTELFDTAILFGNLIRLERDAAHATTDADPVEAGQRDPVDDAEPDNPSSEGGHADA